MTRVSGEWLEQTDTQRVLAALTDAGHQAYVVGGCVRNALLGAPVNDVDIATSARPQQVIDIAKSAGMKPIPTGIDHGTITVVASGVPHEVTTFRKDVETDGRRAVVSFSDAIEDDAKRRDFTMNALYADAAGTIIDPLGGMGDIKARRVRFIENPNDRIAEDYLRILRFFRFHAWYGDPDNGLDAEGLAAIAKNVDGLDGLSNERVGHEVLKLLAAPDPAPSVAAMAQCGVLGRVLPGADHRALAPLVHLEAGGTSGPIRRLAVLGGQDVGERLRLSKKDAASLDVIRRECGDVKPAKVLGYLHGPDLARDIVLARAAILESPLDAEIDELVREGAAKTFPITAADLMPDLQGAQLGAKLKSLEQQWIASDFTLTKAQLLA